MEAQQAKETGNKPLSLEERLAKLK